MNNPLISIIIPVYNVEQYLEECVCSVLNQTYTNFEVILVDDGSPDNSPALCDKFAKQDERVIVIHKTNGGLSDARNAGLSKAQGDFVFFLDSDDFWRNNDDLENIVAFARSKSFDFTYIEINRSRYLPSSGKFYDLPTYPETLAEGIDKNQIIVGLVRMGIFPMSACTKLLNRKFLVEHNISFIKGIFSEDTPWFLSILKYANAPIYYTNLYMYGNRGEVATSLTSVFSVKKFRDVLDIVENGIIDLDDNGLNFFSQDAIFAIKSFYAYRLCIMMGQNYRYADQISCEDQRRLENLLPLLEYRNNPKVRKVSLMRKLLGTKITSFVLAKYMVNRDSVKKIMK